MQSDSSLVQSSELQRRPPAASLSEASVSMAPTLGLNVNAVIWQTQVETNWRPTSLIYSSILFLIIDVTPCTRESFMLFIMTCESSSQHADTNLQKEEEILMNENGKTCN